MKKSKKISYTDESKFTFFKNNLKSGEFQLTLKEIKEKYLAFLATKDNEWILYYGGQTVVAFISDKDGLSSVSSICGDQQFMDILTEVRHTLACYQKPFTISQ